MSPPMALNTSDSGNLIRYLGLKASSPMAAERLNDGRNSFRALSTSHLAALSSCSACTTSGRFSKSCAGREYETSGIGSSEKSTFVRVMGCGKRPASRFKLFSVSTIDWRSRYSSACALASSASNFSTASCVSASASF